MVSWFLIIVAVVLSTLTIVASTLLVIEFGHPDDKNVALFPKLTVIAGFFLAFIFVLALPLDVANSRGTGGQLRMDIVWQLLFVLLFTWILVVLPYAFWFYESDNDQQHQGMLLSCAGQAGSALRYTILGLIISAVLIGISYIFFRDAEVPVQRIQKQFSDSVNVFSSDDANCGDGCTSEQVLLNIPVSFLIYSVGVLSFVGWFMFSVFVGVGFIALPVDLINEYRTRPVPMTVSEYAKAKTQIGKKATELLRIAEEFQGDIAELGRKINRKSKKQDRSTHNRLETELYALKNEYRYLEEAYFQKGGNPIQYFAKLFAGSLGILLSFSWLLHIVIYLLFQPDPISPFLNTMFIDLETAIDGFSLFGVVAFSTYALFLLWCTVKGTFKVGLRLPGLIKIYPMEFGNTMMNAFVFNLWVILVCVVPVIQFCAINFDLYVRQTEVDLIFGTQVQYLKFFRYFWENNVFAYIIIGLSMLTLIVLIIHPKDKGKEIDRRLRIIAQGGEDA